MEIAIISGKGGTGKSSISAAFATLQNEIVLADCDVDAANLYLLFNPVCDEEYAFVSGQIAVINQEKCDSCGVCIDYCRFYAIVEKDHKVAILETLCDGCLLCSRVCPREAIDIVNEDKSRMYAGYFQNGRMVYGRLAPGEENSGRLVNLVREKAKQIAKDNSIKTIIIDGLLPTLRAYLNAAGKPGDDKTARAVASAFVEQWHNGTMDTLESKVDGLILLLNSVEGMQNEQ